MPAASIGSDKMRSGVSPNISSLVPLLEVFSSRLCMASARCPTIQTRFLSCGAPTAQAGILNTRTEYDLNENAREQKLRELALLNGGVEVAFDDTTYAIADELPDFESIRQEAIEADPNLQALRNDRVTALRQIRVNKAKGLPGLELGYRMNPSTGGRRYNGFLVGISIPLFSNRNYVRQAKAQALYAENRLESANDTAENELARLYSQALTLRESLDKYQSVLDKQNNVAILERAIQAGQISMIEYFVNVTTYYQSLQNYFTLQNQYQKVMAQLYKYRL